MDIKQNLEKTIKNWWSTPLPNIIDRETDLFSYYNLPLKKVVSVVGFRRCGKTYTLLSLAKKIGKENCIYVNLENEELPSDIKVLTQLIDLLTEMKGQKSYTLLLDEIQNIDGWETWARRITETTNHKIFISGSSSKLASSELPSKLRGRSLTVKINPLSFNEFLTFKNADIKILPKPRLLGLLREYLVYGGFPEIVLVEEGKKGLVLDEYNKTFVKRDIIERHKVRNTQALADLIRLLLNSSSFTITKLTNSLKSMGHEVGKATISKYISYLEESYFVKSIEVHTQNIKKRSQAPKKHYFVDNFFISHFSSDFSQNLGRLMENLVANNLNRAFYWKDYQNHEVDFVIREKENVKALYQVSYVSNISDLNEREARSLIKAEKEFGCKNAQIITWDLKDKIKKEKLTINLTPLDKFLLG